MYQTIYEIGAVPPCAGEWVGFMLAGGLILALERRFWKVSSFPCGGLFQRVMVVMVGAGFVIGGAVGLLMGWFKHEDAYRAYSRGDVAVLEGEVEVLREQPAGGYAPGDLIDIGGRELEVDSSRASEPGYRWTVAQGGVLRDGAQVRLAVHEGRILKVDLKEPRRARAFREVP